MTRKAKRRRGLPKGAHRVVFQVKPAHINGVREWQITQDKRLIVAYLDKASAVSHAAEEARGVVNAGGFASVRIHDRNGKFQSERTYPRSSDPMPPRG